MSSGSDHGLSDVLRQMAEGKPTQQADPHAASHEADLPAGQTPQGDVDDLLPNEVHQEAHEYAAPTQSSNQQNSQQGRRPKQRQADNTTKAFAVPVLGAVGMLLLVPAIWSLIQFSSGIPEAQTFKRTIATIMLLAWPMSFILVGGSIYFYRQVQSEKLRQEQFRSRFASPQQQPQQPPRKS